MNIFNIIGPVMIGPSSSHTAGACRIGRVANKLAGDARIIRARIQLSGSFARTYRGHGTDNAILAGILGYYSWSEELRDSMRIAAERGLSYEFVPEDISGAHPNTARIYYECDNGKQGMVEGASIGGGNIQITNIDGMEVNFTGDNNTLLILHHDRPGVIAAVTQLMYEKYADLNIGNFRLSRKEKGGQAMMMLELDQAPPEGMIEDLNKIKNVERTVLIRALG